MNYSKKQWLKDRMNADLNLKFKEENHSGVYFTQYYWNRERYTWQKGSVERFENWDAVMTYYAESRVDY